MSMAERRASRARADSQPELPVAHDTDLPQVSSGGTDLPPRGPLLYSSVRALRDFEEYGFIFPNVFHRDRDDYQDGSHIVESALVWTPDGMAPVPVLAARKSRRPTLSVMLEIEEAWHPPASNRFLVTNASGKTEDEVPVLVSGGFVPFDAIRSIIVSDPSIATEAEGVYRSGTPGGAVPEIRVVPDLFANHPQAFVPIGGHLENICVNGPGLHIAGSADRLLGALCHASHAVAGRHGEVAKMFSQLVMSALGIGPFPSSTVSAIGHAVSIASRGSNPPLPDHDARMVAIATRLLSRIDPPSDFVRDTFVKDLQDELQGPDTTRHGERSQEASGLDGVMAVMRNEAEWDAEIGRIGDASRLAIAYLVRGRGRLAEVRDATGSSPNSPEACLMALALTGTLHRLSGTDREDRPRDLMNILIRQVARAVSSTITGGDVPMASVELRPRVSGPGTIQWTLLIDQAVAHEWVGPDGDGESAGTVVDGDLPVDTGGLTTFLPEPAVPGVGGDAVASSSATTTVRPLDRVAERSVTSEGIELAALRATRAVDEGVRQLIKAATRREETCARLAEAEYLQRPDQDVKDFKRQRDEADRELEGQMVRLQAEYAELSRLRREWLEASREGRPQ